MMRTLLLHHRSNPRPGRITTRRNTTTTLPLPMQYQAFTDPPSLVNLDLRALVSLLRSAQRASSLLVDALLNPTTHYEPSRSRQTSTKNVPVTARPLPKPTSPIPTAGHEQMPRTLSPSPLTNSPLASIPGPLHNKSSVYLAQTNHPLPPT
ncbi:hypothetical protein BCR34DRAFT_48994, partial [Clohesyomyces aquaticus]